MLGPEWTCEVSPIYCDFKPSLKLHRHCWNISSSFKTRRRLRKPARGTRGQAGGGDDWSQLPLRRLCGRAGAWEGSKGLPEVMPRQGQRPLGCAEMDGAERLPNPRSISCFPPGEGNSSGQKGRTTVYGPKPANTSLFLPGSSLHPGQPRMYEGSGASTAPHPCCQPCIPGGPAPSLCLQHNTHTNCTCETATEVIDHRSTVVGTCTDR